ncbi:MAG: hypothetical protein AAF862_15200 [Pseudomonadota bacterium]
MTTWILRLLLFLLPLSGLVYWVWLKQRYSGDAAAIRSREIQLLIAGIAVIATFVTLLVATSNSGGKPGDFYIPPYEEDGKIISGQFISREEAIERGLIKKTQRPNTAEKSSERKTVGD